MLGKHNTSFLRVLITFLTFVSFKIKCFLSIFVYDEKTEGGSPGQVLSLLTFIKNTSPRHVALRHRIHIGELQLSWQNRPAGNSRLSIPTDTCLICNVDSVTYQSSPFLY